MSEKGFCLIEIDGHPYFLIASIANAFALCLPFLLYLKLNYVEKVMKREIGNGFCDGELLRTVGKIDANSGSISNLTDSDISLRFCVLTKISNYLLYCAYIPTFRTFSPLCP